MRGKYIGNIPIMRGATAKLRYGYDPITMADNKDELQAQFDDKERWGTDPPSLACGWHPFARLFTYICLKKSDLPLPMPCPTALSQSNQLFLKSPASPNSMRSSSVFGEPPSIANSLRANG